jgi:stage II sporulation protein D
MLKRDNYLFLLLFLLCFLPANAQELLVDIGIVENSVMHYIRANHAFYVYSLDNDGNIKNLLMKKQKADRLLLRYSSQTNDKLVIAAAPDLQTSSDDLLFMCNEKEIQSQCIWALKENLFDQKYQLYRGALKVKVNQDSFTIINKLDIEDYLKGVVPSEMPTSWPLEALKAQAVAARTYTLSKLKRRENLGFDLKATVEDQVYKGYAFENERSNQALAETKSMALFDSLAKPIDAYFFSQAGAFSSSAQDVWGLEYSVYLRANKIEDQMQAWKKTFSFYELNMALDDLNLADIVAVTVLNYTPERRVQELLLSSPTKHIKLQAEELRHKLTLRSTNFKVLIDGQRQKIDFIGYGFGHGIGMSQYGAKKLAQEEKKSFKEILQNFYSNASLKNFF